METNNIVDFASRDGISDALTDLLRTGGIRRYDLENGRVGSIVKLSGNWDEVQSDGRIITGQRGGRRAALSGKDKKLAEARWFDNETSAAEVSAEFGVGVSTLYRIFGAKSASKKGADE